VVYRRHNPAAAGSAFLTRRWERYLLLIPYVLLNLMPDYAYQHNVFFQYVFGSAACLVYLTVLNLTDLRQKAIGPYTAAWTADIPTGPSSTAGTLISSSATAEALSASSTATVILTAAVAVCAVCFVTTIVPRAVSYPSRYVNNRDDYQELRHTLSRIPDEASVTASAFYSTFLSQRDILYDIHYASREHLLSTEFVVLDPASENDLKRYAGDGKTGYEGVIELLNKNDYQLYIKIRGTVEIYRRSQLSLPDNLNQYNPFTQNE
jgi:hypothetical protein